MPAPSILSRLKQLVPGFTPRPTPPALVVESPEARRDRIIGEAKQALDRSRGRPAPSVEERVPQHYYHGVAGKIWFLPAIDSATNDSPEIRAAMRLMIRDAYVKAAWEPLCIAVESEEWQIQPSESGNPGAEEQAEFVTTMFNDYTRGGMSAIVRAIIGQLGPDGFGLAEKVWAVAAKGKLEGKIILEAAKAKDPQDLRVKGDAYGNVTHVSSTRRLGDEYPITDFLYSRYPGFFDEPLGMAAFRASYAAYWMRDTVRKLRIIHTEKKMAGMLVGTYAAGDDDAKATLSAALREAKSTTWMAVPEGTRVEAMQLSTASEPDYKSHEESLRDEIVTGIAFATLQTMTASVPGEGRGDSEVQKETSELAAWRLMSIVLQVVNEQLIPDLIDYNFPFPAAGGYPKLSFGAISKDDILKDQQVVQGAQAMGLVPSKKHYGKAWSVQLADPNDPDDQMQEGGPQPPPGPGGGGGFGGGSPFGFSEVWSFAEWQPYKGPEGGTGWTNGTEVRYQDDPPDDEGGRGPASPAATPVRKQITVGGNKLTLEIGADGKGKVVEGPAHLLGKVMGRAAAPPP
ncbi:MAG TPA: DUF935 family protein, partial [Urbifossiella sp.]|nr:DUF935 family protein [Urbifossiella sp.]